MTHEEIRTSINMSKVGRPTYDKSSDWKYEHYRPYVNSLIKLGYIQRTDWDKIVKLKKIPTDMTFLKAKELSKGIQLPKRKNYGMWGVLVDYINNYSTDNVFITLKKLGLEYNYDWYAKTIRQYLGYLNSLEIIEYIDGGYNGNHQHFWVINRLKQIPDRLTSSLVKKMLYDNMYRRKAKIDKIKENLNNI